MRSAELVRHASCGAAGDGGRGQVNRGRDSDTIGGVGVTAALSLRSRHDNAGSS